MITNVTLENFKCFRKLEVNLKRTTVFVGPNGTGKSSVLQALALLKQSVGADRIQHQGEFVSLSDPSEFSPNYLPEPSLISIISIGFAGNAATGPGLGQNDFGEDADFRYSAAFWSGDLTPVHNNPLPKALSDPGFVLQQLRVVPAVRGLVRPQYRLGAKYAEDVSLSDGLSGQEEQTASNLGYSRLLEESISKLLKTVTGTGLRAEAVPPQSVEVKSVAPSGAVNMVSEGFGSNALVLLLLQLVSAEKGATVLIEEPEIHLHPKAQADLAQVLAETAKDDDKQLIITTHSEHFAGRLLTLVAERRLAPDELAIYSFEKDEKGECFAKEIEVTDGGQVIGGLKSFFDTDLAEWDRYMKARMPAQ